MKKLLKILWLPVLLLLYCLIPLYALAVLSVVWVPSMTLIIVPSGLALYWCLFGQSGFLENGGPDVGNYCMFLLTLSYGVFFLFVFFTAAISTYQEISKKQSSEKLQKIMRAFVEAKRQQRFDEVHKN